MNQELLSHETLNNLESEMAFQASEKVITQFAHPCVETVCGKVGFPK
jgi:hypothetical protein